MNSNDCLRRIRYILDLNDNALIAVFAAADKVVSRAEISAWLKRDDDPDFVACSDRDLATFLNGLINTRRGRKDGPQPEPEAELNNNIILRKLKIAFDLQADDVLDVMALADFKMSRHELSAFFRRPGHKHYRTCLDQILRNFLQGLQYQHRGSGESPPGSQ